MSDPMVLKTQQWLNKTYSGKEGYGNNIPENGNTGWTTIYALLRAFQIELGIKSTANAFGPSTIAKFKERFPEGIKQQNPDDKTEDNIYGILQGACWCKGYSTGSNEITKNFYSGTGSAIAKLKTDAGCSEKSSTVTLNVMKALMSMDQFKKVNGGTDKIRTIQQKLNNKYEAYIGLSPCDGLYGREMNKSLIKVLQAIEGLTPEQATGNFGATTKAKLPILPNQGNLNPETEKNAILLARYALCCNGYTSVNVTSDKWDSNLRDAVSEFQSDMYLSDSLMVDVDTWMSLLLSKGNPDRKCEACDTRFEMTDSRLEYLKKNGYLVVGRYLTGGDFKELRLGEVERILKSGIKLFLIFQESTTNLEYFTKERGRQDAKNSVKAARKHGIPAGNIIYFAVDTDPTDPEISKYILPYFESLSQNMTKAYKVGIYGTRNVCNQVMNKGYAKTCFVSDMSTGFSGNMGFKMPKNWNLDQFHEISGIVTGNTTMDLDKVAYCHKYPVVETSYQNIINYTQKIRLLEEVYKEYKTNKSGSCSRRDLILGVTNFIRNFKYGDAQWYLASLAPIDKEFIEYLKNKNIKLYEELKEYANTDEKALCDIFGGFIDIGHLGATIEGYYSPKALAPDFWFGWGGDLASLMSQVDSEHDKNGKDYFEIATSLIGENGSNFGYPDICSDADSIRIAELLKNTTSNNPVSEILGNYYTNNAELRISYYLKDLNVNPNLDNIYQATLNKMSGVFEDSILIPFLGKLPSTSSKKACCKAFAQYILDNYPNI